MMKQILMLVALFMATVTMAQTNQTEVMPQYPGGDNALRLELKNNFVYPESLNSITDFKRGIILVRFVVQEDGSVGEIKVERNINNCTDCATNSVNAIKALKHKFAPGTNNGTPTKVWYTLPLVVKGRSNS